MDIDKMGERVGVVLTTLLAMCAITNITMDRTPTMMYIKGIEVYLLTCTVFIFLGLAQTALVSFLHGKEKKEPEAEETARESRSRGSLIRSFIPSMTSLIIPDSFSRIIFPVSFLIFNMIFWIYYFWTSPDYTQDNDWTPFKNSE